MHKQLTKFSIAMVVMIAHTSLNSMFTAGKQAAPKVAQASRAFVRRTHSQPEQWGWNKRSNAQNAALGALSGAGSLVFFTGAGVLYGNMLKNEDLGKFITKWGRAVGPVVMAGYVGGPAGMAGWAALAGTVGAGYVAKKYYDEKIKIKPGQCL